MKKLPIILAVVFVLLSCVRNNTENDVLAGQQDMEDTAVRIEADATYTNTYLGFSYTIPKDWWLYDRNDVNFVSNPLFTVNPEMLDISYGTDGGFDYSYIELAYFANLRDSLLDNHISFYISAETLDGINSLEEYMEYLEEYLLRPDENFYELLDSGREEINGLVYEKRYCEVIRESGGNYIHLTYTRPARNNYYLTIKASYWPMNRNAEAFIKTSLSRAMPR